MSNRRAGVEFCTRRPLDGKTNHQCVIIVNIHHNHKTNTNCCVCSSCVCVFHGFVVLVYAIICHLHVHPLGTVSTSKYVSIITLLKTLNMSLICTLDYTVYVKPSTLHVCYTSGALSTRAYNIDYPLKLLGFITFILARNCRDSSFSPCQRALRRLVTQRKETLRCQPTQHSEMA